MRSGQISIFLAPRDSIFRFIWCLFQKIIVIFLLHYTPSTRRTFLLNRSTRINGYKRKRNCQKRTQPLPSCCISGMGDVVSASHQLALTTSLPFVHTARRYYRLNGSVRPSNGPQEVGNNHPGPESSSNLVIYRK